MSEPEAPLSRRSLLGRAAAASAGLGLAAHAAAWMGSLAPTVRWEPPSRRRLGPLERFPEGVTFLSEERLFLLRERGRLRALSAVCTHLGCTVERTSERTGERTGEREEGAFRCPCHGSVFGPEGENRAGPAPRPLPWRPLEQTGDGTVVVDLAREVGPEDALAVPIVEEG